MPESHPKTPSWSRKRMVWIIAGLYLGACVLLYLGQRSMVYHPRTSRFLGSEHQETCSINEETIQVSILRRPGKRALLYFGGNAEDVSRSLLRFGEHFPNHSIFAPHYRGFCKSSGSPSEDALHRDAQEILRWVKKTQQEVILVGRSLGTGIAIRLTHDEAVERLVLITPYDSILAVAKQRFWMFPVRWILKDTFDSQAHAGKIRCPTTILTAELDKIILKARSDQLIGAFRPEVLTSFELKDVNHNSISEHADYWQKIKASD